MEEELMYGIIEKSILGTEFGIEKKIIFFISEKIRDEIFDDLLGSKGCSFIKFKMPYSLYDQYFGEKSC